MKILLLIDLINDMVHPDGKLAGKGYAQFAKARDVAASVVEWRARSEFGRVIHVGLEFEPDYANAAQRSLLLGKASEFGVAARGQFGSEFVDWAKPESGDIVIRKHRISAFYGTDLDVTISSLGAKEVVIGGCATDLAVSSAVRDAHDRDLDVAVAEALCVAASDEDQNAALLHLRKIGSII